MYKVVTIDNFNRDSVSDILVVDRLRDRASADAICKALNTDSGRNPHRWHVIYPQDKPLYKFEL